MSFRRLPDRLDPNRAKSTAAGNSGVVSSTSARGASGGGRGGTRANSHTYNYSNGGLSRPSSRESSFSPWPCSRCTLVNEKPLAPICEACGAPKPDYICTYIVGSSEPSFLLSEPDTLECVYVVRVCSTRGSPAREGSRGTSLGCSGDEVAGGIDWETAQSIEESRVRFLQHPHQDCGRWLQSIWRNGSIRCCVVHRG